MGNNVFGCEAGVREGKSDTEVRKPGGNLKNDGNLKKPLLGGNQFLDDMAAVLEEEIGSSEEKSVEGASIANFKANFSMATRVSVVCMLLSTSIIVPPWNNYLSGIPGGPAWMAYVPGGVVLMVVFTVYKNLGGTIQLAYQGGAGTFIACLWAHCMSAIMPGGASGDHYNPVLMNTSNVLLIVLTYSLNFSKNVRMFIISYHVFFAMSLMNPDVDPGLNMTWAIKWDAATATTLGTALLGLAGAVVTILFPTPLLAKAQARAAAHRSVFQMNNMMKELFEYYKRKEPSVTIQIIGVDALELQNTVDGMAGDIESSWWEHFDFGNAGKRRALFHKHVAMLETLSANVSAMQIAIAKEDFGDTHNQLMDRINGKVDGLLNASADLLTQCTASMCDGDIDAKEKEDLTSQIDITNIAIADLAKTFNKARQGNFVTGTGDKKKTFNLVATPINDDLQAESFFVYCLSVHARSVVEYTQTVINFNEKPLSLPEQMIAAGKGIFAKDARVKDFKSFTNSFAVRGSLEVLVAYYMGMYLFGYNAAAACTVSLLLADFTGSAIIKNLGRLQGVVLSAVVPHLIANIQGSSCDPAIVCLKLFSVFAWELLTNYIYMSSTSYGYIGCLCAAFALGTLIYPCQHETGAQALAAETAYDFAQYTKILQTTISVIIMMVIDSILSAGRASDLGTKNLLKGMTSIEVWLQAAFMKRDKGGVPAGEFDQKTLTDRKDPMFIAEVQKAFKSDLSRHPGRIIGFLSTAAAMGAEADKEPRYYRTVWPAVFFDRTVHIGYKLRAKLNMIEQVLKYAANKETDDFATVRKSAAWKACQADATNTLQECLSMLEQILANETDEPKAELAAAAAKLENADELDDLPKLMDSINATLKYPKQDAALNSLEEDPICRINVTLVLMVSMVEDTAELVKECLKMVRN